MSDYRTLGEPIRVFRLFLLFACIALKCAGATGLPCLNIPNFKALKINKVCERIFDVGKGRCHILRFLLELLKLLLGVAAISSVFARVHHSLPCFKHFH